MINRRVQSIFIYMFFDLCFNIYCTFYDIIYVQYIYVIKVNAAVMFEKKI